MRRLGGSSLIRRVLSAFKAKRILRVAEWEDISVSDPNLVQYITDAMAFGSEIQINYEGSGWRTILPYSWNTSKAGNILLMCYKDTGEIRSYRLDRVLEVKVDNDSQVGQEAQTESPSENSQTPGLSNQQESTTQESPFQEEINILTQPSTQTQELNTLEDQNSESEKMPAENSQEEQVQEIPIQEQEAV